MIPLPVILLPLISSDDQPPQPDIIPPDTVDVSGPVDVRIVEPDVPFVNAVDHTEPTFVKDWDHFIGQESLKRLLRVHIAAAERRMATLPHTLLASGMPGVGKTTLARLIAQEMGGHLTMLVPPFTAQTLYKAALQMRDYDVLFIDEIHKLADRGPAAAENLLHMMEEGVLYLEDGVHHLVDFTLIGATTDADKLPQPIIDRFPIRRETGAHFERYTLPELVKITKNFSDVFEMTLLPATMVTIAKACRGIPRVARDLVELACAVQTVNNRGCTSDELHAISQTEPDGTTWQHKEYLLALYQFAGHDRDGTREYIAGEATLMNLLLESKPGIARVERFLIEKGLVDRTRRGRRLTDRGIRKVRGYVERGESLSSD